MLIDPHMALADHERRISELEAEVERLRALLTTPIALTPTAPSLSDAAEQLVLEHLPVVAVEKEQVQEEPPRRDEVAGEPVSPRGGSAQEPARAAASTLAATPLPRPLSRNFRPSGFGYTVEDFTQDYPDVNPVEVLESFFNHFMAKGDVSRNWLEKFWSYARIAQQMEKDKKMSNPTDTDSTGMPTDRKARREMLGQ